MRARILVLAVAAACGGDGDSHGGVSTDTCTYQPLTPTAHAGGTVTAQPLTAGAADRVLDVPVGTALGGYTARAGFLGSAGVVDARKIKISGTFNPSIGVEAAPRVKALALTAGDETVVLLKVDMIFVYEGMVYDLEQRLGPEFAGKVIITASHSHSAWAQFTGNGAIKLGSGEMRQLVYNRFLDAFEGAAKDALTARRPAKIGIYFDGNFDPMNVVNHDRRGENDMLPGGNKKDDHLFLVRVDGTDNVPIAILPIFGEHGTLNGEENPFASSDAPGALERALQEQFDTKVVVMHLQSAGGDNSPSGHGGLDCSIKPGADGDPCLSWTTEEGHGRAAAPILVTAWQEAGKVMKDTVELEMITRSIETGPYPETFDLRDGALKYAPFDRNRMPDGKIYNADGTIASPIDEFNAPVGAALCEKDVAMFPAAMIPGTDGLTPYGSCLLLDQAAPILEQIFQIKFGVDETHPICQTTRTTISALRINDYVFGTMPGELTVMLASYLRAHSPVPADKFVLLGYAQGHVGYMLEPEDWLKGGYEPSITFWGPLEAEYIANQLLALVPLAQTPAREDGTEDGAPRVATATMTDNLEIDDPAMNAGMVPQTIPAQIWARSGHPTQAQPAAQIPRISGIATFVWIGDDPQARTPHVTLLRESAPGVFTPATRRSGRVVDDVEVTLAYTPDPLQRSGPQTHYWVAEWQAVPWQGSSADSLDERGNLPLGRYKFHVEGKGWALDSDPFQVVAGGLNATATRAGTINVGVRWNAPKGWRLLDMDMPSNKPVPVRSQQVQIQLLDAGSNVLSTASVMTDAAGNASVANNASATMARVADRFGNQTTVAVP